MSDDGALTADGTARMVRVPFFPPRSHDRQKAGAPGTTFRFRWCEHCGRGMRQAVGGPGVPDACLGLIPGVSHACCGHGTPDDAYVVLGGQPDQSAPEVRHLTLRGRAAITFFNLLRLGVIEDPAESIEEPTRDQTPPAPAPLRGPLT